VNELLDWTWTAVMVPATVLWALTLRRHLRHISRGGNDDPTRVLAIATITVVCVLMLASSLLYAEAITVETSRFYINAARIALLVGGIAAFWVGRRKEVV
jgi:hypothetical protein